ncbi:hypothetical protein ACA910_005847 [Epithemia clementina (nom. ined.)]
MTLRKSLLASLLLLVVVSLVQVTTAQDKCPCKYDSKDEKDCYSYSQGFSGTGSEAWPLASESCLQALGVEERILPNLVFWSFCPYPNRTNVDYAEIISFLQQQPDHPIAKEIMQIYVDRGIFEAQGDGYVLPDTMLTERSSTINCTEAPGLCWGQVRVELEARTQKMNNICKNLHDRQLDAWQTEQGKARMLLCDEAQSVCEPLSSQVQSAKTSSTNGGACSNLGIPIAREDLKFCNETQVQGQSSGAVNHLYYSASLLPPVLMLIVIQPFFV